MDFGAECINLALPKVSASNDPTGFDRELWSRGGGGGGLEQ